MAAVGWGSEPRGRKVRSSSGASCVDSKSAMAPLPMGRGMGGGTKGKGLRKRKRVLDGCGNRVFPEMLGEDAPLRGAMAAKPKATAASQPSLVMPRPRLAKKKASAAVQPSEVTPRPRRRSAKRSGDADMDGMEDIKPAGNKTPTKTIATHKRLGPSIVV